MAQFVHFDTEKEILIFAFNKMKEQLLETKKENEQLKLALQKYEAKDTLDKKLDVLFRETDTSRNSPEPSKKEELSLVKGRLISHFVRYVRTNTIDFRPTDMKEVASVGNIIMYDDKFYLTVETYTHLSEYHIDRLRDLEDIFHRRGYRTTIDKQIDIEEKQLTDLERRALSKFIRSDSPLSFARLIVEDRYNLENYRDIQKNVDDYIEIKEFYHCSDKKRRLSEVLDSELDEMAKRRDYTNNKN